MQDALTGRGTTGVDNRPITAVDLAGPLTFLSSTPRYSHSAEATKRREVTYQKQDEALVRTPTDRHGGTAGVPAHSPSQFSEP